MSPAELTPLTRRAEFLAASAKGRSYAMPGLVLQARRRDATEPIAGPRVGFTASRRVGGAVQRNRAKRRLRAVARDVLPAAAAADTDYVLIARSATVTRPYAALRADLQRALEKLAGRDRGARRGSSSAAAPPI